MWPDKTILMEAPFFQTYLRSFFVLELIYVYNHADKSGDRKVTDSCGLQK